MGVNIKKNIASLNHTFNHLCYLKFEEIVCYKCKMKKLMKTYWKNIKIERTGFIYIHEIYD